ncbi:hypothetical protein AVEN_180592-1 [Araneus ventricosus]|uniref:Integrase zinc-binding domain-containing protein n=1 Tax=Araneus ventricosus TaxID=182803 RepID=A0A4Y2ULA3_ARAVE|nr:hypothetical protein AVEN_180592-1 [Araneus ventricosus]
MEVNGLRHWISKAILGKMRSGPEDRERQPHHRQGLCNLRCSDFKAPAKADRKQADGDSSHVDHRLKPPAYDGVLHRRWESVDGRSCRWQLILPKSRIPEVLRETHDSASGGHFGVMKTLSKTRERVYWDRLRADIEKWCRECHACGTRKGPKTRTKGRLQRYNIGAPFERMALDILGPLSWPNTTIALRYSLWTTE